MSIVTSRLEILIVEFLLDVPPDFTVFEIGIELDYLNHLFFGGSKFVEVESDSVEGAKDDSSDVECLGEVLHYAGQLRFLILLLLFSGLKCLLKPSTCFYVRLRLSHLGSVGLVHLHFSIYITINHLQLRRCAAWNILLPSSIWIRVNLTGGSLHHITGFSSLLAHVVGVVRVKRPLGILEDTVLHFDAETLIFFLVKFDKELTGV